MRMFKVFLLIVVFLAASCFGYSQGNGSNLARLKSNTFLYSSFTKFYKTNIKKKTKSVKGKYDYYQINGVHFFDYNDDGLEDSLIEFSTIPVSNSTQGFTAAVLFKKIKNDYKYIAHMQPNETYFEKYSNSVFYFLGDLLGFSEEVVSEKYLLQSKKFVKQ